ncbi:MAG: hypothetical protein OSA81_04830 [Longimicrobiales bacterium]|nr:hypothetical protein [Longimicrobiales bacterium]
MTVYGIAERCSSFCAMVDDDTTLGGYFRVHDRPPAFEGSDGHPYTVSVETEKTGNLRSPVEGFLVFPRWAQSGVGIVGHVETAILTQSASVEDATDTIGRLTLYEVHALLEDAVRRSLQADAERTSSESAADKEAATDG